MAPVYHGQWSFDKDTFCVTSSGGHVHPRATYSELDDIFCAPLGDIRDRADHQDHWYEAQLLHFGLPPTRSKAAAKMRLMDAFQDETLDVPEQILRIEQSLSKKWAKRDSEARVMGPSMRPLFHPIIGRAAATDTTEFGTTQKPWGNQEGNAFGTGFAGGASMQGNMRPQRNQIRPHAHSNGKKRNHEELPTRPMKNARSRGETGGPNLQDQIQVNPNGETFHQRPTVIPVSVGNGQPLPAPGMEFQQIGYQTVPLSHQTTYETDTRLSSPGLMDIDGPSD
ncbi:hypothetical protein DTO013E5_6738 [Penicillium roqueforti]|uniref:Genomic scaffold, ProqFM164S04 n=1 Tax=Penicillium roqueforti (strain FM164) TaxID=1365484 RepID=W6QMA6_PENRF|nr:uncharacterized protein LCP9604111_6598 [Penicillium roqueforti]CDM35309.1 unnamed protein product [Penicillium roqueforti FM164]KAF9245926.1 hypothetical protein LCP9604111_6598 [Penicillium roqueforti]KAI2692076.1 hypothetical protein LCP963914a_170 [Penicillium roqueforti]KAI2718005.1 hypothetical protein CBS147318_4582 [Penicillium roqueforti]KAI2737398.1 hypothetical protein DTO012A1_7733 [Penicillium roqueforti]